MHGECMRRCMLDVWLWPQAMVRSPCNQDSVSFLAGSGTITMRELNAALRPGNDVSLKHELTAGGAGQIALKAATRLKAVL